MNSINADLWRFKIPPECISPNDFIKDTIIGYIENEIIAPGHLLPSYRVVAESNKLSRSTMQRLYQRLEANGWVESREGVGTFVSRSFPGYENLYPESRVVEKIPLKIMNKRLLTGRKPPKHDFMSIGVDTPYSHFLPHWFLRSHLHSQIKVFEKHSQIHAVTAIEGLKFREAVLNYLNRQRDFMINENCLDVVLGRRGALEKIFGVLTSPGDVVVNFSPKDTLLWQLLNDFEVVDHHISVRHIDFMERLKCLLSHTQIRVLYIRPQCSYPEGFALSPEECTELIKLAQEHSFYIVEEDDYHELWYGTKPFKPLINYDHQGYVVYSGALSLLSPYLQQNRVIVGATKLIKLISDTAIGQNPFRDLLAENAIATLLTSNKILASIKKMQRQKKAHVFEAWMQIENALGQVAKVHQPKSGLAIWLTFPSDGSLLRTIEVLKEKKLKIAYHPDSQKPDNGVCYIRFAFGVWDMIETQEYGKVLFEELSFC